MISLPPETQKPTYKESTQDKGLIIEKSFHCLPTICHCQQFREKKEVEGMILPAILSLLVVTETAWHCSATQIMSPVGGNHTVQKRQAVVEKPTEACNKGNERAVVRHPDVDNLVWTCNSGVWTPNWLTPSIGATETVPGRSCKQIRDVLANDCTKVTQSGAYWVKVTSGGGAQGCCQEGEELEVMKMYCEMELDGGGWTLVWKHSYLEVGGLTEAMKYFSSTLEPCYNLSVGWCNFPCKERLRPTEMAIAAYHEGTMVYAYKAGFNRNLDSDWRGGVLVEPVKLVDRCTGNNGIQPAPFSGSDGSLFGLAFDKHSPHNFRINCDTIIGTFSNPSECRWHDCRLPPPASRIQTQMTMAIYVR